MANERGKINNKERSLQVKDYSGLKYGAVTPSDIDGFVEFKGKLIILWELKLGDTKIPNGQRWGLERMCDAMEKGGIPSYLLVCRHNVSDTSKDIDVSKSIVDEVRCNGRWRPSPLDMNMREMIDLLRKRHL